MLNWMSAGLDEGLMPDSICHDCRYIRLSGLMIRLDHEALQR